MKQQNYFFVVQIPDAIHWVSVLKRESAVGKNIQCFYVTLVSY